MRMTGRKKVGVFLLLVLSALLTVGVSGCALQQRYESILATRQEGAEKAALIQRAEQPLPELVEGSETVTISREGRSAGKPYRIRLDGLSFQYPSFAHITIKPAKDPQVRLTCEKDRADLVNITIGEREISVQAAPEAFIESKAFDLVIEADYNEVFLAGAMPVIIDATGRRALLLTSIGENNGWVRNLNVTNINARFQGKGSWQLRGYADDARLVAEGESVLLADELVCDSLNARAADGALLYVTAKKRLHAGAADHAQIFYRGNPRLQQQTVGEGSIDKQI